MKNIGFPELSFDISESNITIEELEAFVKKAYGPNWRFSRTESRYESCVMAIFECD